MNKNEHPQPDFSNQFNTDGSVFNDEEAIKMLMTGIVNSAMDAIISVDERQKIILFNSAAEAMFRCPADKALGSPLERFIPKRFRHSHRQHIHKFDQSNATSRRMGELGIIFGLRADDEEFPIEASISQIEVDEKKFFTVILRDITKRRLSEQKLLEQAALLEIAQDAIIVRDFDDRILFWNKSAERIYGYSAEETLGKIKTKLLYADNSSDYEQALKNLFTNGIWKGELRQITKDGREIIVECRWTLVRDDDGKPKSILSVNSDITERKTLEAKFMRAQRLESIGTLAGGIAHDLNNVLAPILMAVPALEQEIKEEKSKRRLEIIRRNAKLGADIIQQILSFARGKKEDRVLLEPTKIVYEICSLLHRTFPKTVSVTISASDDSWKIFSNETEFNQMLMNICVNARDAMPDGGTLTISVENIVIDDVYARMRADARAGRFVRITVEDSGTGIVPEIKDRIFDPFFTTKEIGEGTGLGLATVLEIIRNHDGFIDVYSEPGVGTTFKIHLPAHPVSAEDSETAGRELPIGDGELILVADDEATFRQIAKDTLETFNYRVLTANDGSEVVSKCLQYNGEIKVVLLDLLMPKMDGWETIRSLEKLNPNIRVIAASGFPAKGKQIADESEIVKTSITKPYTAEKLLRTVADVLR